MRLDCKIGDETLALTAGWCGQALIKALDPNAPCRTSTQLYRAHKVQETQPETWGFFRVLLSIVLARRES